MAHWDDIGIKADFLRLEEGGTSPLTKPHCSDFSPRSAFLRARAFVTSKTLW